MEKRSWEVVHDDVRGQIERGDLAPGDTVPGEIQLAEQHKVSRPTVRQALARLEQDGLLTEGAGRLGRTVRSNNPLFWHLTEFERGERHDDPIRGIDAWDHDIESQGKTPRQDVSVLGILAPRKVANWLGVAEKEMLIRRRRIRYADDVPISIADTWFPIDIANMEAEYQGRTEKPLLLERDIAMPGGIIRCLGIKQVKFLDEIRVRMPSPEENRLLDLPSGSPVGEHSRIGIDDAGRRIRVISTVFPGHRLHLRYELEV